MIDPHIQSDAIYTLFKTKQTRASFMKAAWQHPDIQMGTHPLEVVWDVLNIQRNTLVKHFAEGAAA
jgi:hypothetical protein